MVVVSVNEEEKYCVVEPQGALTDEDFAEISRQVDPLIEREGKLKGLIIKTRDFPGWENLSGLIGHLKFVKNHHQSIKKVALVTDAKVAEVLPSFVSHFVQADIKHFDFDDHEDAVDWVSWAYP
jgi:hypothetical protein